MKKFLLIMFAVLIIASLSLCKCTVISDRPEPTPIPCITENQEPFPDNGYSKIIVGTDSCIKFQNEVEFALVKDEQGYAPYLNPLVSLSLDMTTGDCWMSTVYKYCTAVNENSMTVAVTKN